MKPFNLVGIVVLFMMSLGPLTFADSEPSPGASSETLAKPSPSPGDCPPNYTPKDFEKIDNFANLIQNTLSCTADMQDSTSEADRQTCILISWAKEEFKDYPYCGKFFVNKDGQVGELAKHISSLVAEDIKIHENESVFMKDNPDFELYCKGFKKMTPTIRVAFYTWIFEITAFMETTCKPETINNSPGVPNGPAVGLYQLEDRVSLRSYRGPHCKVSSAEIRTAKGNTGCAFDIMKGQLERHGRPFGVLNEDKTKRIITSYWYSHNPLNAKQEKAAIDAEAKAEKANKKPTEPPADRFFRYVPRFPLCKDR